jgi:glucose/arabinose dehydrogenase/cytochrome c5
MKLLAHLVCAALLLSSSSVLAEFAIGKGSVKDIYDKNCASCHGQDLNGGSAGSLIDAHWQYGGSDKEITNSIAKGIVNAGMPAWEGGLSEKDIRSLVIYIREQKHIAGAKALAESTAAKDGVFSTKHHNFTLEQVATAEGTLWGMDFLPDGSILATEQSGKLWHFADGKGTDIQGLPDIWVRGQGGLLDVGVHPNYAENGWVYLAFSEHTSVMDGSDKAGMTAIVRGKIADGQWTQQETIFQVPEKFHSPKPYHFGTRLVFKDGYLFFSIGDRGTQEESQDLSLPNGKIHRIYDDGRVPDDNPFSADKSAYPTIWTYGNRNPQGLILEPNTGDIWESEHGPRGGDEINVITKGLNYGWPVITYGMNYNGSPITEKTALPGMEQPKHYWTPSIATAGIAFYSGDKFANWQGNLFVSGLSGQRIQRLVIKDKQVVDEEVVLKGQGRVRDLANGPDGYLYAITNDRTLGSKIMRLKPKD